MRPSLLLCVFLLFCPALTWAGDSWVWIAYGDTRTQDQEHRTVLKAIRQYSPDYRFMVNVGDVVEDGSKESMWKVWQSACDEELGGTGQEANPPKYLAVPGNHDQARGDGAKLWQTYLKGQVRFLGYGGRFGYFDYHQARFLLLDSENPYDPEQKKMVEHALATNRQAWLFAIWHKPIFAYGVKGYEHGLHQVWGIPFYRAGGDAIFSGHAHVYLRMHKITLDGDKHPALNPDRGTALVISGNGGAPLHSVNPRAEGMGDLLAYAFGQDEPRYFGYTEISLDGERARLRHIRADGEVMDEIEYGANPKPAAGAGKVPAILMQER